MCFSCIIIYFTSDKIEMYQEEDGHPLLSSLRRAGGPVDHVRADRSGAKSQGFARVSVSRADAQPGTSPAWAGLEKYI